MKALTISFLCAIFLDATAAAQISVSVPTDPEVRDRVQRVQVIPASQLDKELPNVSLGDWLLAEAGPDAKIAWYSNLYDLGELNNTADPYRDCGFVYADTRTYDGREFLVKIATGGACKVPVFDMGWVALGEKEGARLRHLSDLPPLRWRNPTKTRRTEGTR